MMDLNCRSNHRTLLGYNDNSSPVLSREANLVRESCKTLTSFLEARNDM